MKVKTEEIATTENLVEPEVRLSGRSVAPGWAWAGPGWW